MIYCMVDLHGDDRDTRIWGRVEPDSAGPYPDTVCIVGHTPTVFLTGRMDEDYSIWHGHRILDIDCTAHSPTGGMQKKLGRRSGQSLMACRMT